MQNKWLSYNFTIYGKRIDTAKQTLADESETQKHRHITYELPSFLSTRELCLREQNTGTVKNRISVVKIVATIAC